jgi:hypothetical protein
MTIEQTVEIPADRRLTIEVPRGVPVGRARITFFPLPDDESKNAPQEDLPKVTRAEIEAARQDPVIRRIAELVEPMDLSWLPEGLTRENLTMKDVRALRLKEKYGI